MIAAIFFAIWLFLSEFDKRYKMADTVQVYLLHTQLVGGILIMILASFFGL